MAKENMIRKKLNVDEVILDKDLYPRKEIYWMITYKYVQNMEAGAVFPPITVAYLNGKYVIVDGMHRLSANRKLKRADIDAEVYTGWDRKRIYLEALKRNTVHGQALSPYELRVAAQKLMEMKLSKADISKVIQVPLDNLDHFTGTNLVNTITGKQVTAEDVEEEKTVVIKSTLRHLGGSTMNENDAINMEATQQVFSSRGQIPLLRQMIALLENQLLNLEHKDTAELFEQLKTLVNNYH